MPFWARVQGMALEQLQEGASVDLRRAEAEIEREIASSGQGLVGRR